jgi:hypothetical protein
VDLQSLFWQKACAHPGCHRRPDCGANRRVRRRHRRPRRVSTRRASSNTTATTSTTRHTKSHRRSCSRGSCTLTAATGCRAGRGPTDGHNSAPRRVSAGRPPGGSSPPIGSPSPIVDETDSAAELPWRDAIPPLRGDRDETGGAMTEASERRADTTRQQLIAAASRQFAHRTYSMVSLDDILAEA